MDAPLAIATSLDSAEPRFPYGPDARVRTVEIVRTLRQISHCLKFDEAARFTRRKKKKKSVRASAATKLP
jgi:hypothetical protein